MVKRELKVNLKSFLIWSLSVCLLLILVFCIYPSISHKMEIDKLLTIFPDEIINGFNFNVVSLSTVFGWYASEGFMITTLIGGLFAVMLGANILLKEESDKTINFLYAMPISRNKILGSKILAGALYIIAFNLLIMIVTGIGFKLSGDFELNKWLLLTLTPILVHLVLFVLTLLVSCYMKKTGQAMGLMFGVTLVFYMLNMISQMDESLDFLSFITPFGYIDVTEIVKNGLINWYYGIILVIGLVISFFLVRRYNNKELI